MDVAGGKHVLCRLQLVAVPAAHHQVGVVDDVPGLEGAGHAREHLHHAAAVVGEQKEDSKHQSYYVYSAYLGEPELLLHRVQDEGQNFQDQNYGIDVDLKGKLRICNSFLSIDLKDLPSDCEPNS